MALGINVEALRPLLAFADLLAKPDVYRQLIADAEKLVAKTDEVMKIYPTVEAAEVYFGKAAAAREEVEQLRKQVASDAEEARQVFETVKAETLAQLDAREKALDERNSTLVAEERAAQEKERVLSKRAAELEAQATAQAQKVVELEAQEQDIRNRAARIKALAG